MVVADDLPLHTLLEKDMVLLDTHALSATGMRDLQQQFPKVVSARASRPVIILRSTPGEVEEEFLGLQGAVFTSSPVTRKSIRNAIIAAMSKVMLTEATPFKSRTLIANNHCAKQNHRLPNVRQVMEPPSLKVYQ